MTRSDRTSVILRFTTDLRLRLGLSTISFIYDGKTVRDLLRAVAHQFDVADLLMAGEDPLPFIQVVIDGRLSYTMGGLDAPVPDGATVTLISCRGVLTPVPLPGGTTMRELSEG